MIIACLLCSQLSVKILVVQKSCEASCDKGESRSASEPDSASLRNWEWSPFLRWRSLLPVVKQQVGASIGLPGVVEDGAFREIVQEPGRPYKVLMDWRGDEGNHNCIDGLVWESEKPIVVMRFRNWDGAKGLYCGRARVERGGEPLV